MGYVHDTAMVQFIPPNAFAYSAGTWTPTLASNVFCMAKTAAADSPNIFIPISLPGNSANFKGSYLTAIDVVWSNATADLTSVTTVELEKQVIPANTVAQTATAPTITIDTNNDSSAKRLTQAAHTMTVTLSTPVWIGAGDAYYLYITVAAAAGSVLKVFGARAYFTKRL